MPANSIASPPPLQRAGQIAALSPHHTGEGAVPLQSAKQRNPRVAAFGVVPSLTWSVTRSLIRAGLKPVVFGWHRVSPFRVLPGCTYVPLPGVKWTQGELDPSVVIHLNKACRAHGIDQLLAIDFPSISLLASHGESLTAARLCAVPQAGTIKTLHNKWDFFQIAAQLGIPQPRTELAHSPDDLRGTRLAFPIITKPVDRWASVGFQIHDTLESLARTLSDGSLTAEFPVLAQEFIPGRDAGFAFLARHGKLLAHAAFEQSAPGFRRYFDSPELRRHVAALVAHTAYHGVGEVDARYDPVRDEFRLLEVNPRFWASQLYATRAGTNFPELLLKMDALGEGSGFSAKTREVTLSAYEFAVGKAMQYSEKLHGAFNRWRGI